MVLERLFGSKPKPKVYMSADERLALETVLRRFDAPRVLEWGSGGSTVHFAGLLPTGSSWLSIEHQPAWADKVRGMLEREKLGWVKLQQIEPNLPFVEGSGDGDEPTFRDYVAYPTQLNSVFDFVLVDGRARNACAQLAWPLLAENGVLALHDAQRDQYRPARPSGAWLVRLRDHRETLEGKPIELHLFVRAGAEELAERLQRVASDVEVTTYAPGVEH